MNITMKGGWERFSTATARRRANRSCALRRDYKSLPPAMRVAGFLLLLTLWCAGNVAQADVRATVDRSVITENDTLTLTLELDEQNADVDLSPLERDFEVLNNARSNRVSIVNGRVDSRNEWVLTLAPKRSGDLHIPALAVGNKHTAPVAVKVVTGTAAANNSKDVFLEVSVDQASVDVQAQLVYTLRLLHAVELKEGSLTMPELKDAIVERLGEDVSSDEVRDGRRYRQIQRQYAVFPQVSGALRIPPPEFKGTIATRGTSPFDTLFNRRFGADPFDNLLGTGQPVRVRAKELIVDVTPQPKDARGGWWLPAKQLKLSESWVPDPPQFRVGEPVTRTVVMDVEGLTAQQLPDVMFSDVVGFKLYPDQPVKETRAERNGVSARKTQKIAWVATQAGRQQLPALEIPWWDTQQRKMRIATLPARSIDVLPAVGIAAAQTLVQPIAVPEPTPARVDETVAGVEHAAVPDNAGPWMMVSVVAISAWLFMTLAWWRVRQTTKEPDVTAESAMPAPRLKAACAAIRDATGNGQQLRDALLAWASIVWRDAPPPHRDRASAAQHMDVRERPPHNLATLAQHCDDEQARHALSTLDQQLYAPKAEAVPLNKLAEVIWRWAEQQSNAPKKNRAAAGLRALYPS